MRWVGRLDENLTRLWWFTIEVADTSHGVGLTLQVSCPK
jgi:hypothetical protein